MIGLEDQSLFFFVVLGQIFRGKKPQCEKNIQGGIWVILASLAYRSKLFQEWWVEDDPFLLGWQNFRGELLIFQEGVLRGSSQLVSN